MSGLFAELVPVEPSPIVPELRRELDAAPAWMYPWPLRDGTHAPVHSDELVAVHQTRRELIEPVLRQALNRAGPEARVLDLGCNEGFFAHLARACGAAQVVGCDIREDNIRRAMAIREHYAVSPKEIEFRCEDALSLAVEPGRFGVVLALGLIYHLEDPVGALRVARSMLAPEGVCVVESQLTRQRDPIIHGWGSLTELYEARASFAAKFENEPANLLASASGLLSLIPNAEALEMAMSVAGFSDLQWLQTAPHHDQQYVNGDRGIIVGRGAGNDGRSMNMHAVRQSSHARPPEDRLEAAWLQVSALSVREQEAVVRLDRASSEMAALQQQLEQAERRRAEAECRLAAERASWSWRITSPLRAAKRAVIARRRDI